MRADMMVKTKIRRTKQFMHKHIVNDFRNVRLINDKEISVYVGRHETDN